MTLALRYVTDEDLRGEHGPTLLRYLLQHGADEFSITVMALQDTQAPFADAFEDEMDPYERPVAQRRVVTGAERRDVTRAVRRWTFSEESLERLLTFVDTGLFHWPAGPDGWLEDLTIYRRGELVLGLVSHQGEGVLRLTGDELAEVVALDIPSRASAEGIGY